MKGVLAWVKTHLLIVISTAVIVVSLPVGWFISSGMNKGIRETQSQRASQAVNKINSAKVTYVIPSLLPGEPAVTESRPPNEAVTAFYKAQREARTSQASEVVDSVLRFNRGEHELLAPDLLPSPRDPAQATRRLYEFLARMAGDRRTGVRTIYEGLIGSIGAGDAPDPVRLATTIEDLRQRETERMTAESGTNSISAEQQEQLTKLLVDRRLAEAQRRAREVSVFMTMAAFDPQAYGELSARIPPQDRQDRPSRTEAPSLAEAFAWNFDYWVVSDILRAIDRANTDAGGTRANVENAVVKRVERIGVQALPVHSGEEEEADPFAFGAPADPVADFGSEGLDPSVSVTGRVSTDEYDVVRVKLTVVVDATRLPRLFRAFSETNLITVLDLDLTEVDLWGDLRLGYYYGEAPVVRAEMELETVWLRDWTAPLMPGEVRRALGIVSDEGGEG
jgi:hypothetical protein